jgi:hypothetical protein
VEGAGDSTGGVEEVVASGGVDFDLDDSSGSFSALAGGGSALDTTLAFFVCSRASSGSSFFSAASGSRSFRFVVVLVVVVVVVGDCSSSISMMSTDDSSSSFALPPLFVGDLRFAVCTLVELGRPLPVRRLGSSNPFFESAFSSPCQFADNNNNNNENDERKKKGKKFEAVKNLSWTPLEFRNQSRWSTH